MLTLSKRKINLPIVPPYRANELLQSHMRRTADANHISMRQLEATLIADQPTASESDRERLVFEISNFLRHPAFLVDTLTFTSYLVHPTTKFARRQICPECLAQDVTSSVLLAEPAYAICPDHRCAHLARCPECKRNLSWGTGDYFHCSCGFDLRLADRVKVDTETLELFRACLENRPLWDTQAMIELDEPGDLTDRLKKSLAYLLTHLSMGSDSIEFRRNSPSSSVAHQWMSVGQRVGGCPRRLFEETVSIEKRMLYSRAKPEAAILHAECVRCSLTWTTLQGFAIDASREVMNAAEPIDLNSLVELSGVDPKNVLGFQLAANNRVSLPVRTELRAHLQRLRRNGADHPEQDKQRIAALIKLTQELRSAYETDWMEGYPISGRDELFAFIGAGALQPWAPLATENWHVLHGDLERVLEPIMGASWAESIFKDEDEPCVVEFLQVFSTRANPDAWLGSTPADIQDRVRQLVRAHFGSDRGFGDKRDALPLPLGFSAFLSKGALGIRGDSSRKNSLAELRLVSASLRDATNELVRVCLRAQVNYARLKVRQKIHAEAARKYYFDHPHNLCDWSERYVRSKANEKILGFDPNQKHVIASAIESFIVNNLKPLGRQTGF